MSKKTDPKHSRAHSSKKSSSTRVLRAVTYVLTPFLMLSLLFGAAMLILSKPYNDNIKDYVDTAFGDVTPEVKSLRTLNRYRNDDAPVLAKEIEVPDEESGESKKATMIYPYYGDRYATLNCESAGMKDIPVYSGQADDILEWGAGWYNGSSYIGRPGNVVIAAHNHTYFYYLPNCQEGDIVTLETEYCKITYTVREKVVFHEKDYTYVFPTEDDRLTLYTCWNNGYLGMSEYRLAVICDPIKTEWKEVEIEE
ncbi:MAG: class D sortase [Ruminococcus sp.]|nr:class D sortase [Ruminococcus sp.]